ncbi:helix-turn-helix domain-containing protein [Cytobacillus sp. FJAT-54145]|uniref:Helix-turn-helix domain-containing protein n=1 Tax=Cytobacillus spartinae TaxID=3299023 RepID=A0ABW6KIP1_9BACI
MQKSYYAIIPANVRYDEELTPNAKLLYGEITALCNEKGFCWASNSYFSDLYGVSKVSISKWINQLVEKGYIQSEINYKEGSKEILNRYLRIVNEPIKEKLNTPIKEKFKDNNTSFNTTSNITKEYKDSCHKFQTCDMEMAQQLYSRMLENNPDAKKPNLNKWADEFRLMRDRDNRTEEQLRYLIDWTQSDSFWKTNILSPAKLRKQFDQLAVKVREDIKKKNQVTKTKPKAFQSLEDWADES